MVALSRLCPIGTGPPPFAPPWPIYLRNIFSGSGVLTAKHGGAEETAILMVKLMVKL